MDTNVPKTNLFFLENTLHQTKKEKFRIWRIDHQGLVITVFFIVAFVCLIAGSLLQGNGLFVSNKIYPEDMNCTPIDKFGRDVVCEPK